MSKTIENAQYAENAGYTIPNQVKAWMLKIILDLGGHREFIHKEFFSDDQIANLFKLDDWINKKESIDRVKVLKALKTELNTLENEQLNNADYHPSLTKNLENLQSLINLNPVETRLLEFMLIVYNEPLLNNAMDLLGDLSSDQCYRVLSVLLNVPENETRLTFSSEHTLAKTGLVRMNHGMSSLFRHKIDLLSRNFIEAMFSHETTPYNILKDVVTKSQPTHLTLDNYNYLQKELAILLPYLKHALSTQKKGVNILIYGEPGTGKTEFARVIGEHFKLSSYEVISESSNGESIEKGDQRLYAYLAAQNFFSNQSSLIIFDEIEDIFHENISFNTSGFSKAWFNHILENNQIPTLWICNELYDIEPSLIRRFDFILNLKSPPKTVRKAMLQEAIKGDLEPVVINELASSEHLVPAIINRVANVLNPIQKELNISLEDATTTLINSTLKAQGNKEIRVKKIGGLSDIYDPSFTNADLNLSQLADRLKQFNEAKICLYGPSGTGKSAFVHWLSDYLNKPVLIKKVSDLMDKYVGETEKQIASAFHEANNSDAILLMDEVDSFLRDRRHAQQSYEVTMVNEMLTQMEEFSGIFIATTNLMDHIDQAMLRRFDFKVRFNYLTKEQIVALFKKQCEYLGFSDIKPEILEEISKLTRLTPGDFAITARQTKLGIIDSADAIAAQLKKENSLKEIQKSKIGF